MLKRDYAESPELLVGAVRVSGLDVCEDPDAKLGVCGEQLLAFIGMSRKRKTSHFSRLPAHCARR